MSNQITPRVQRQAEEEEEELIQAKALDSAGELAIQRQPEEEEEELLQTKPLTGPAAEVTPNLASAIASMQGGGQPLPASERAFFEPRFGCDFNRVRIHVDSEAADLAKSMKARAFTIGRAIAFGAGQYSPGERDGRHLLAHELTHTVQQGLATLVSEGMSPMRTHDTTRVVGTDQVPGASITVDAAADPHVVHRATDPDSDACFTKKDSKPPAGWDVLREKAKNLDDNFREEADNDYRFRNKGAAQYRITTKRGETPSDVIAYHSGREGYESFNSALKNLQVSDYPMGGPADGGNFHQETVMIKRATQRIIGALKELQLDPDTRDEFQGSSIQGYVFSFFSPCSFCRDLFLEERGTDWADPTPVESDFYVHSACVPGASGHNFQPLPPVKPKGGAVCPKDSNYGPARTLVDAYESRGETGWTKYTIKDKCDDDKKDSEGPQSLCPAKLENGEPGKKLSGGICSYDIPEGIPSKAECEALGGNAPDPKRCQFLP